MQNYYPQNDVNVSCTTACPKHHPNTLLKTTMNCEVDDVASLKSVFQFSGGHYHHSAPPPTVDSNMNILLNY